MQLESGILCQMYRVCERLGLSQRVRAAPPAVAARAAERVHWDAAPSAAHVIQVLGEDGQIDASTPSEDDAARAAAAAKRSGIIQCRERTHVENVVGTGAICVWKQRFWNPRKRKR